MSSVLTRIIQAVSPKAPGSAEDLLSATQREVWPFLQQVRRKINEIITVIDTYPTAFDDHTALTAASRATARQHPSGAINTDDGATFIGRLIGTNTLRQALAILDALVLPAAFPGFYPGPMKKVGTDDPGNSGLAADGKHSHPPGDPEVEGSYLYTALVGGLSWDPCATTFGGYIHPWNNGWTETSPGSGVWNRDELGAIDDTGVANAFFDGVTPTLLMRVFSTYSPDAAWRMFDGIYIVTDLGSESTHGQVTRATDLDQSAEFIVSKCVQVTGGASNAGHVFRYNGPSSPVVETDLLAWEDLGVVEAPDTAHYELLTAAQLVTELASSTTEFLEWSQTGGGDSPAPQSFLTISGTPGTNRIPAGLQEFRFDQVSVATADTSGSTVLKVSCNVMEADGTSLVECAFTATSLPIVPNQDPTAVRFQYTLPADIEITSANRLELVPILSPGSTAETTMRLCYNNSSRGTWWKTTMQFSSITSAEEDWFDCTIDGDGILNTEGHTNLYVHGGTLKELNGIMTAGHRNGHTITCTFSEPIVMNDGASVASGVFRLYLEQPQMGTVKVGCAIFRMIDVLDETDPEGGQIECWRYNGGSLQ